MKLEIPLETEADTLTAAQTFGHLLNAKGVVYLKGQLGAGKTTFCRGILRSYGYQGAVKSPTFTLVEPYDLEWGQVYHFDLYRIADPEELEFLGVEDYLEGGNLCLIEWSERGEGFLPDADIMVEILVDKFTRRLILSSCSKYGEDIVARMTSAQQAG